MLQNTQYSAKSDTGLKHELMSFCILQITWADLHFQHWMDFPSFQLKVDFDLSKYPKLDALKKRVEKHPKVAAWISKRPC